MVSWPGAEARTGVGDLGGARIESEVKPNKSSLKELLSPLEEPRAAGFEIKFLTQEYIQRRDQS